MTSGALFSPCRTWRYNLWRRWNDSPAPSFCVWICLNPSTADETEDDPTVARLGVRSREYGFDGLVVLNLFAYRSTDPRNLKKVPDPVGPENDKAILAAAATSRMVVCAWGNDGKLYGREHRVLAELRRINAPLHYLARAKTGSPVHPLYRSYDEKPIAWT